jgi:hypothetical protein
MKASSDWVKVRLVDDFATFERGDTGWMKRNTERPSQSIPSWWLLNTDGRCFNVGEVMALDITKAIRIDGKLVPPTKKERKAIERVFNKRLSNIKKLGLAQHWREYQYKSGINVTFKGKDKDPHVLQKGDVWAARKEGGRMIIAFKKLGLDPTFRINVDSFQRLVTRSTKLSEILFG